MFYANFLCFLWLSRYLFCCSYSHNVAPKGKFIAFVSTEAETDHPQTELKPGIDLLGPVDEIFYDIYDRYEPVNEPSLDNCFISTVSISRVSLYGSNDVDRHVSVYIINGCNFSELWCHNTLWVNCHGCTEHVYHDNWKGKYHIVVITINYLAYSIPVSRSKFLLVCFFAGSWPQCGFKCCECCRRMRNLQLPVHVCACNAVSGIKLERMWGLDTWTLSWFLFLIVGDFIIIIM